MIDNPKLSLALARVMIAHAWVDGEVQPEEIVCLKDFLIRLPGIDAKAWQDLKVYLTMPIEEEEREQLIEDLRKEIQTDQHKKYVYEALDLLQGADGVITTEESQAINQIRQLLELEPSHIHNHTGHNHDEHPDPARRIRLDHPVYSNIETQLEKRGLSLFGATEQRHKLCLCGCLMARLANADGDIDDTEIAVMKDSLERKWDLSAQACEYVVHIALWLETEGLDLLKLIREFYQVSTPKDRTHFLDVLIQVIRADGIIKEEELDEFKLIARAFGETEQEIERHLNGIPRTQA